MLEIEDGKVKWWHKVTQATSLQQSANKTAVLNDFQPDSEITSVIQELY